MLLRQVYVHPTGQIPAYEWNFSDVNPPVQAWAAIFLYRMEQALHHKTDLDFLKRVFGRLTSNFGWWVNRKDPRGQNVFQGGFLGLDNIGVFDRSNTLPTGGQLEGDAEHLLAEERHPGRAVGLLQVATRWQG